MFTNLIDSAIDVTLIAATVYFFVVFLVEFDRYHWENFYPAINASVEPEVSAVEPAAEPIVKQVEVVMDLATAEAIGLDRLGYRQLREYARAHNLQAAIKVATGKTVSKLSSQELRAAIAQVS